MKKVDIIKEINQKVIDNLGINGKLLFDDALDKNNGIVIAGIAYNNAIIIANEMDDDKVSLDTLDENTLCDIEYYLDEQIEADNDIYESCIDWW